MILHVEAASAFGQREGKKMEFNRTVKVLAAAMLPAMTAIGAVYISPNGEISTQAGVYPAQASHVTSIIHTTDDPDDSNWP
ncbi:hypothetical protein ACIQAC_14460 [Streptomyces sp. NPDC088387]|uniref:hypothetical protein n=1 Tax=Streptomyces sp. NPDC088387 TaxID=3365859 RepID=UPI00381CBB07